MNNDQVEEVQTAFASDIAQLRQSCGTQEPLKALRLISETWLSYADGAPDVLPGYSASLKT